MAKRVKHPVRLTVIFVLSVVLALLIICQTATALLYRQAFAQRFSSEGNQMMLSFADFPELERVPAEFSSDQGQLLRGYYYFASANDQRKAVIVLSHGFGGGGHRYYLPQIAFLAERGYLVFAFDKTGTDESEGENVRGIPQGIIDLKYAIDFVGSQELSAELPLFLYGHSWGAYSTCAVLEDCPEVRAAVSLSAFNRSQDMLLDQGTSMYGGFVRLMSPFLKICDMFSFGSWSDMSMEKGLKATQAQVLLFHSADDPVINIRDSFDLCREKLGERENLTFVRLDGKGHNVFQSSESSEYEQEIQERLNALEDGDRESLLESLDLQKYTGLDDGIMNRIVNFYDSVLRKGQAE